MSGSWFHLRTGRKHVLDAQGYGPKMRTGTRTQSQRGHRRESQQVFSLLGLVKPVVVKGDGPAVWRADCRALIVVADILQEIWPWRSAGAREERVFRRRYKERQRDALAWGGAEQGEGRAHLNSWIPPSTVSGNLTFAGVFTYLFIMTSCTKINSKWIEDWKVKGKKSIKQQEKKSMPISFLLEEKI